MRLIQVLAPDDRIGSVTDALDEEGFDYVRHRTWAGDGREWLVEVPVPTDAVGYVLDRLDETGIDSQRYVVISSLETAMTPRSDRIQDRFADDFDPLAPPELHSKARDLSHDRRSFLAMVFLSAVIAVGGLLAGSPAVVVGSMVIAPIVGPVLTASVGAVTGDRGMLLHSVWLQAAGLAVATVGAWAFSLVLQHAGVFPPALDISSIDLIALRVAPNFATLAIGLAAGAAAAYGLTTKGPTSLIGVMIAAALIPAAATVGIAAAWGEYRILVGALVLLLLSMILINVGALAVLWGFYSGPGGEGWPGNGSSGQRIAAVATAVAVVAILVVVGVAAAQQITFERTVTQEVGNALSQPEYGDTQLAAVRIEYAGVPFGSPETVTVVASRTADGDPPPSLADELDRRITEATGRDVTVQVRFRDYQRSDDGPPSGSVTAPPGLAAPG